MYYVFLIFCLKCNLVVCSVDKSSEMVLLVGFVTYVQGNVIFPPQVSEVDLFCDTFVKYYFAF